MVNRLGIVCEVVADMATPILVAALIIVLAWSSNPDSIRIGW
jgi:hypothetical protein